MLKKYPFLEFFLDFVGFFITFAVCAYLVLTGVNFVLSKSEKHSAKYRYGDIVKFTIPDFYKGICVDVGYLTAINYNPISYKIDGIHCYLKRKNKEEDSFEFYTSFKVLESDIQGISNAP